MQKTMTHLWRIELDTDLPKAGATMLPLGLMIEAEWKNRARGLGMLFRRGLTRLELDRVNSDTWPEMGALEPFMRGLFSDAWTSAGGATALAARFPVRSSLRFLSFDYDTDLGEFDRVHSVPKMLQCLLEIGETWLVPAISAPIVKMPERRRPAASAPMRAPDFHTMAEAGI